MAVNHLGTLRLDIHHNRASGLRCRGGAGFDKDHLASKKSEFSAKILRFFFRRFSQTTWTGRWKHALYRRRPLWGWNVCRTASRGVLLHQCITRPPPMKWIMCLSCWFRKFDTWSTSNEPIQTLFARIITTYQRPCLRIPTLLLQAAHWFFGFALGVRQVIMRHYSGWTLCRRPKGATGPAHCDVLRDTLWSSAWKCLIQNVHNLRINTYL